MIKPIVEGEGAFDKKIRARRLNHAITNSDKGKSTIYRLVRRYWQRGQIKNALLPDYKSSGAAGKRRNFTTSKAGRPRMYGIGSGEPITENIRKQFRIICDKYLMNDKGYSIRYAYNKFGKVLVRTSDTSYRPSIEVWCYPPQQKNGFYATEFSNVPALYRGKIINQRELSESYLKRGRHTFKDGEYLRKSTLSEFPDSGSAEFLRKKESEQNAFVLDNRGNAPKLIIPKLELARILFYASSYLSRASLMSSRLLTDFKVEVNTTKEDYANIEVLQTSNFPPSAFNDSATRAMLSWLLIDRNAKRSFESIFKYFSTENHLDVSSGYQRWLFYFDPPQMAGWSLAYEGSLDASGEYFLVEKITDIEINAEMPYRIYFHNPSFTHPDESMEPTVGGQSPKPYERPEDHTVDGDREACR